MSIDTTKFKEIEINPENLKKAKAFTYYPFTGNTYRIVGKLEGTDLWILEAQENYKMIALTEKYLKRHHRLFVPREKQYDFAIIYDDGSSLWASDLLEKDKDFVIQEMEGKERSTFTFGSYNVVCQRILLPEQEDFTILEGA